MKKIKPIPTPLRSKSTTIEKALVIDTGEILNVENSWIVKMLSVSFTLPEGIKVDPVEPIDMEYKTKPKSNEEGAHYILSDGNTYSDSELVVGLDNIREYQINKINK
jgi:hypothetical protein